MAEIIAALEFGPGHAWVIFDKPIDVNAALYITRDSDTAGNLGANGWQAQSFAIVPIKIDIMENGARVLLGPDVVDYVLDGEAVTVKIGKVAFFAFWPPVTPAPKKSRQSITEDATAKATNKTAFERKQEPTFQSSASKNVHNDTIPNVEAPDSAAKQENEDIKQAIDAALAGYDDLGPIVPKKPSIVLPLFLTSFFALVAIIIGGYFIYSSFFALEQQERSIADDAQPTPNSLQPSATTSVENQGDNELTQVQRDFALGPDGWNNLISSPDTDPQRLFDLGRALRNNESGNVDIGFEAIYRAGQRKNRAALEWYAKANDPTSDAIGNDRIVPPNIRRAFESWKTLAEQDSSMRTHITRLCNNLRDKRFSGTPAERTTFQDYCQ